MAIRIGFKIVFGFLFFSLDSLSQQKIVDLDPVTVTSSLSFQKASQTGRNIVVVKGEEFGNLPVHSLDELLRYVPGVEVQARGPMGSQSDIVIRGGTFQQVLVILDGIRLNDPITGHFNSYIPIAPAEIERIEILKGASSAIYGTEAVGGVIHIITKTFAKNKIAGGDKKYDLSAQGTLGEFNLIHTNLGGYYHNNNTAIGGGFLSANSKGQPQRGARGYFNNQTASLSFNQRFSDQLDLSLRSAYDDRDFSAQNFYTTFVSDTAREKVKTLWNQASLNYHSSVHHLSLDLGYKNATDIFTFNSALSPNENKSGLWQALGVYRYNLKPASTITTGLQFQNRSIRSNDRGNHELKQGAAFAILNHNLSERFFIAPALRLDWDQRAGMEVVPQLNVSYKLQQFQLRASTGKTIRQADFTERFNNYNKPLVTSGSIGNPDLVAERSFSNEAGIDWIRPSLKLSATIFNRAQSNVIDWVVTPYSDMPRRENLSPNGTYALASNISKVDTRGIETDIQYMISLTGRNQLWTTLGLTWLKSESTGKSFYISSHANVLANFSARFKSPGYVISLNGLYKNRNPQQASAINATVSREYFVLNLKAEARLWQNAGVYLQLDNIFDKTYQDILGSPMPGRWLMGGINLNFNKG
jgi:vitamin B12 transporter